uniref:Dynein heavy chain, cytoplasmic n=1 Tax=Albugo laibachii Nc14 TaxID=890382 RepID=F0W289_9STRA|nr:Cytoplasmic dynein 1 heavy chain 1 putative [Albugo laibachii Nc14]|eukprot:CCA15174.1 Cytoplasmic dynein 1 heavy chain 1 putative [Albugo laibachii Nc14]
MPLAIAPVGIDDADSAQKQQMLESEIDGIGSIDVISTTQKEHYSKCKHCEHDVAASDAFCIFCGAKVDAEVIQVKDSRAEEVGQSKSKFAKPEPQAKATHPSENISTPDNQTERKPVVKALSSNFHTDRSRNDFSGAPIGSKRVASERSLAYSHQHAGCSPSGSRYEECGTEVASLDQLWVPDSFSNVCMDCNVAFGFPKARRHHCRVCGLLFCRACVQSKMGVPKSFGYGDTSQRCCRNCVTALQLRTITSPADVFAQRRGSNRSPTAVSQPATYYRVLQISKEATREEIKHQYQILLACQNDPEKVAQLKEAFDHLQDPLKRKDLDVKMDLCGSLIENESTYATQAIPTDMVRSDQTECQICFRPFKFGRRQHHCRRCTRSVCNTCSEGSKPIPELGFPNSVRHCNTCLSNPPKFIQPVMDPIAKPPPGFEYLSRLDIRISVSNLVGSTNASTTTNAGKSNDRSDDDLYYVKTYCEPNDAVSKKMKYTITDADRAVANDYNIIQNRSMGDFEWLFASLGNYTNIKALPFFPDRKLLRNERDSGSSILHGFLFGCLLHPLLRDADCYKAFLVLPPDEFNKYRRSEKQLLYDNEKYNDIITAMRLEFERAQIRRKIEGLKERCEAHGRRLQDQKTRLAHQKRREEGQFERRQQATNRFQALESRKDTQLDRMYREKDRLQQQSDAPHILFFDTVNDETIRNTEEDTRGKEKVEFRISKDTFQNDTSEWNQDMALWSKHRANWSEHHNPAVSKDIANEWIIKSYGVYLYKAGNEVADVPRELIEMHKKMLGMQEEEPGFLEEEGLALDDEWMKLAKEREHWATDRSNMKREDELCKDEDLRFRQEHSYVIQEKEARQKKKASIEQNLKALKHQIVSRSKFIAQRREQYQDLKEEFEKEWRVVQHKRSHGTKARLTVHQQRIERSKKCSDIFRDQLQRQIEIERVLLFKRALLTAERTEDGHKFKVDQEDNINAQEACRNARSVTPEYIARLEGDLSDRIEELQSVTENNTRTPYEGDDSVIDERDEFMNEVRIRRKHFQKELDQQREELDQEGMLCTSLLKSIKSHLAKLDEEVVLGSTEKELIQSFQTMMKEEVELVKEETIKREEKKEAIDAAINSCGNWVMEALHEHSKRKKREAERLLKQAVRAAELQKLVQRFTRRVVDQEERIIRQKHRLIKCEQRVEMLKCSESWYQFVTVSVSVQGKKDAKLLEDSHAQRQADLKEAARLQKEDQADNHLVLKDLDKSKAFLQLKEDKRVLWARVESVYNIANAQERDEDVLMTSHTRELLQQVEEAFDIFANRLSEEKESLQHASMQLNGEIDSIKSFMERMNSEENSLSKIEKGTLGKESHSIRTERELIERRARSLLDDYKHLSKQYHEYFAEVNAIKARRSGRESAPKLRTAEAEAARNLIKAKNFYDGRACSDFTQKFGIDQNMRDVRHVFDWLRKALEVDIRKSDLWLDASRTDQRQIEVTRYKISQLDRERDILSKIPAATVVQEKIAQSKSAAPNPQQRGPTGSVHRGDPISEVDSHTEKWIIELIELNQKVSDMDQKLMFTIDSAIDAAKNEEKIVCENRLKTTKEKEYALNSIRYIDQEARGIRPGRHIDLVEESAAKAASPLTTHANKSNSPTQKDALPRSDSVRTKGERSRSARTQKLVKPKSTPPSKGGDTNPPKRKTASASSNYLPASSRKGISNLTSPFGKVQPNLAFVKPASLSEEFSKLQITQFVNDPSARVLQVHWIESNIENNSATSEQYGSSAQFDINIGMKYPIGSHDDHNIICFIKRQNSSLSEEELFRHQLQIMTIGLKDANLKSGTTLSGYGGDDQNAFLENEHVTGQGETNVLSIVYNYIHQSLGPLVQEYAKIHHPPNTDINSNEATRGLPAIRRRMKELELALLQYQQNIEIPEVKLVFHPVIQSAASLVHDKGVSIDMEALKLEEKLQDVTFLNEIQAGVNRWIKEIQKLTKLINEPLPGTSIQEINFWSDLHRALLQTQELLASPEVEITMATLKRAKRYLVTVTFSADHGLNTTIQQVTSVMSLMKDFPIGVILSATDLTQLTEGVLTIFNHLKKIRVADEYKLSRLLHFVEIISSDLMQQIQSLLRAYKLIQMPYDQFHSLMGSCKELFTTWHRQVGMLYEVTKELSKRRGTMNTDKPPLLSELQMEHVMIEERLLELAEFREQHQRLCQVIERVLFNAKAGEAIDDANKGDISDDALTDINTAYDQLALLDLLDVSSDGNDAWQSAHRSYDFCIDRVEGKITTSLISRLSMTSNADEMFRVFSKYNALFFRPRIRSAVQQFQMQLIEKVKEDVGRLQAKFRAHYAFSEASRTSKLRDIPPVSGAIMWARQIERKLKLILSRVENVLGTGWEQHVEGRALKMAAEAFMSRLNPQLIFDQWVGELASMPIFDIKNIILNIITVETAKGPQKRLVVAFNHQIVTLFKEVRNLDWLNFRVPFTLKMIAEDAKSKYPHAMSLDASLKTYTTACQRIQSIFEPLAAGYVKAIRVAIGKTFVRGNEMRWHADGLGEYVLDVAVKAEKLHDKVEELIEKCKGINEILEILNAAQEMDLDLIRSELAKIQAIVDELSLSDYNNLDIFVSKLNDKLSDLLAAKLQNVLDLWVEHFNVQVARENGQSILAESAEKWNASASVLDVASKTHQIVLRNQVLSIVPSLDVARSFWLEKLHQLINGLCCLPKIQTSSYENVYGPTTSLSSLMSSSTRRRDASMRRKEVHFEHILHIVPKPLVIQAYRAVNDVITAADSYAATWLHYQTLWDMDAQTAIASLGEDLLKWQQILLEIKRERSSFDVVTDFKRFGPIAINYQQVQAQVNVKYDAWHNEFISHFADLLCKKINEFYGIISSKRTQLESHVLEAATAQVVSAVTLVQEMKRMRSQWKECMESFAQGENLLKRQRYKFDSNWPSLPNVEGEWDAFLQLLERKSTAIDFQLPQLQTKVMDEKTALEKRISEAVSDWDSNKPLHGDQSPKAALEMLVLFESRFKILQQEWVKMEGALEALELTLYPSGGIQSSFSNIKRVIEEIAGLDEVWRNLLSVWTEMEEIQETMWSAIQARKIRRQLEEFTEQLRRLPARVQQYEAFEHFIASIQSRKSINSLLSDLKSDAIRERHWKQILALLKITCPFTELTLRNFWESRIAQHEVELKSLIQAAQGEMALDEFLRQLGEHWNNSQLELVAYQNRCRIVRGWDEIFAKLEEHLNSLSSMKQSPFYRVFADLALNWEEKLNRVRSILDAWIDVQRRWVYLEGIFFGSADIKQQLPKEYMRFQSIDNEFMTMMKRVVQKPLILEVANIPNLLHSLERQQEMMGNVQRALGEYLERQRATFPRFYFVGDEDLLEIIGNSKEPVHIQRHLSKMFAGIASLKLSENDANVIVGMVSREGEEVLFKEPVCVAEDSRVNIWLRQVEVQMHETLAHLLTLCYNFWPESTQKTTFIQWISSYPAQIIILATQVRWSNAVEIALNTGGSATSEKLDQVVALADDTLHLLSQQVLLDITTEMRKKYEQLITEIVHERSVTLRLYQAQVTDVRDFRWIYHMRYYFNPTEPESSKRLTIKISDATFPYGFEYLGVGERLVQTPLTERCYLTLTQALDFGLGGNPFGPAGTGKTESVKALGAQLGRFVLVFNCDEHFDFQAMGRIFVGLCQVGAWGCFDEFNRLEERVLSAVSQQILAIQSGVSLLKARDTQPTSHASTTSIMVELLGKNVKLHANVGIFVTMNPGYAGRSNLPDNLKQLFRSIAMAAPDRELIAQVMLFSQGITIAQSIAAKVVLLFRLCEDQLSKQPHYDFGLRALKSVLVSAGHLKRKVINETASLVDIETIEMRALMGSINDTILPKLIASDVAVFETLFEGTFPNVERVHLHDITLRQSVQRIAQSEHLVLHEPWILKILQLQQVTQLRHGVMLVGPSGTGKTRAWQVLLASLEAKYGMKSEPHVIDPKALSKEHLYGSLDNTTLEWTDGVFTSILRQILNSVRGESDKRHWIIFDGDVDPEWAENLNSVLDDNRILTLPSGERLELPSNVWIIMETESLQHATLATVSRCGMVWFSEDTISTYHVVEHNLLRLESEDMSNSYSLDAENVRQTTTTYVHAIRELNLQSDPSVISLLEVILESAMTLEHIMDVTKARLLMSLLSLLGKGLIKIHEYNETHADFMLNEAQIVKLSNKWFIFALVWGFGSSMDSKNRLYLCDQVVEIFGNRLALPVNEKNTPENSLLDYEVHFETDEWRNWTQSVPQIDLESHRVLATDVVVPTVDTVRHVEVLRGWLSQHRPLILCGPPGSGKTMTLTSTLSSLPQFDFASLNFSSGTTPELLLKTFSQYCEYKRTPNGMILAPNSPEKWLVVFCDEINLPEADRYGTQRVITFLRQMIEHGGFWLGSKVCWVNLQRIQFVGACNPPTDPGRVPLSLRLLRHAPVLLVDFPTTTSLKQIYSTFNHALLKLTPSLKAYSQPLTECMVAIYQENQNRFTTELQPHYIYSPRELSRWMRALYEALEPLEFELDIENLVRLTFHEALRLFMDRLATFEEQEWCFSTIKEILRHHFPQTATSLNAIDHKGQNPILYSSWLSKQYVEVNVEELRKHVEARLRVFYEEELNVPLVVFDSVLDHVLRIDRVLRQPLGHLLLVGESGAGKTVLSRFVSWMNGMSVFQIKLTSRYTLENFDEDLRVVLKRCGCDGERVCFIFDESNILSSAFLERMNALLASGEVPGLFEDEEYVSLMHACREAVQRDGGMVENTESELFRYFTRQVQRNLHVVFTMNPVSGDFQDRQKTSPALFNRCVVDWFGTWNDRALAQVAQEFTKTLDLPPTDLSMLSEQAQEILAELLPAQLTYGLREALTGSIVEVHHATLQLMQRLRKRHLPFNHISPRDFLEFIRQFVALYNEKRSLLEDQQLHLNIGVCKLQATHEQVAELQGQLSLKEKELKKNNQEANEKLQQMVKEQKDAEEKKRDTEQLAADLGQQDAEITKRKLVVEADLAEAEPALLDAQQSVNSIRKSQLDEIRALARPPAAIRMTLEAVALMLGETSLDWADLRRFIRRDDFISQIVNFDSEKLTQKQRNVIRTNYVERPDEFDYEKVNRASKACGPLFKWVVSQLHFTEILHRIQPLRNEVQSLVDRSATLREQYRAAKAMVDELEVRIEKFKQEYASLINKAQKISNDMEQVNQKVNRSVALLDSLLHESERWGSSADGFELQMATLTGDTLLSAAFLTYIGFLDFQQRKILTQDWRDILQSFGIRVKDDLSFVDYLSRPQDQLEWQLSELPTDELCYENAIILQRFRRFPLIIDPSGQANRFITQNYARKTNTKIAQTSFLDTSFMKVLASAIRFGTALLVHEVENIDPVLNPVLNRELYKTGGRVLIRLAGEEIDYSPDFRLFLITRNPTCRFPPDICSRVTFINFTVTPSSLESQALSILMKSEEPEAERKRTSLLKMQGEYQAKLRELEDSLLQQINNVQGNILDDNSVINSLEAMKAEAAQITSQVSDTQITMESVEQATNRYRPLAKACSKLFFALESMPMVHFLYQFSLEFFLDMLSLVLAPSGTSDISSSDAATSKLDKLSALLFRIVSSRVSRGLAECDKLMFALRMAQINMDLKRGMIKVGGGVAEPSSFDGPTDSEWESLFSKRLLTIRADVVDDELRRALSGGPNEQKKWRQLLQTNLFENLLDHLKQNSSEWTRFMNHGAPEENIPSGWDTFCDSVDVTSIRAAFRTLILIYYLRPDRVTKAAEKFIDRTFGQDFPWRGEIELHKNVASDTNARRGILLCSTTGYDASSQIDGLAAQLNKKLMSVSMGSPEGYDVAEKGLNTALKQGTWLLLRNVHLCPSWLMSLEKKLYNARTSAHTNFRLFLTSEINPSLPLNLIRLCDIYVFEPPGGMKLSILRSLDTLSEERMDNVPAERARLFLLLAWFHGLIQERLRYVPVGWSKAYEFSHSDFKVACDVIDRWVDAEGTSRAHLNPDQIPWAAIRTTLSQSVYGGRIDNEFDQVLLETLLEMIFTPESYKNTFKLVTDSNDGAEDLTIAEGRTKAHFMKWVHDLPNSNSPTWLGLPKSAEQMLQLEQGEYMVRCLQLVQDVYGSEEKGDQEQPNVSTLAVSNSGIERPKWIISLENRISHLLSGLEIELVSGTVQDFSERLSCCVNREVEYGKRCVQVVRGLLEAIASVCANQTKPSADIRMEMHNLSRGSIPPQWKSLYYMPPDIEMDEWFLNFQQRLKQLKSLCVVDVHQLLAFEEEIWLGGLFFPESFITSTRQSLAKSLQCSLDDLFLEAAVEKFEGAQNGFVTSGLRLEGADWSQSKLFPIEAMHVEIPKLYLRWSQLDCKTKEHRQIPVNSFTLCIAKQGL